MHLDVCATAPEQWQRLPIRDVCQRFTSGGTPSRSRPEFYTNGSIGWVKTKELRDGFIYQTEETITPQAVASSSAKSLSKDTILLAMYGATVGMLGILAKEMTCNQACCAMLVKAEYDRDFLFYQLLAHRNQLQGLATGAAQQNLSGQQIKELVIPFPSLHEQKAIGSYLRVLDDRITLLRETNATLEAIAQALFKSWFVDFDPVRAKIEGVAPKGVDEATSALFPNDFEESELGPVPRGWRVGTVESIAERVGMGPFGSNIKVETFVPQGIPVISGQHLKQTLVEDNTFNFVTEQHAARLSKSCVKHGDVIFTHAGNIGQVSMLHAASRFERYVLSQRQFFLRCDPLVIRPEWAIYFFRSPLGQRLILANASQVGVPSIARPVTYLRSIKIVVPPLSVTQEFAKTVDAIHHRVMANRHQLQTLSTLRDTLLPRLISGQLRLSDFESNLEATST